MEFDEKNNLIVWRGENERYRWYLRAYNTTDIEAAIFNGTIISGQGVVAQIHNMSVLVDDDNIRGICEDNGQEITFTGDTLTYFPINPFQFIGHWCRDGQTFMYDDKEFEQLQQHALNESSEELILGKTHLKIEPNKIVAIPWESLYKYYSSNAPASRAVPTK